MLRMAMTAINSMSVKPLELEIFNFYSNNIILLLFLEQKEFYALTNNVFPMHSNKHTQQNWLTEAASKFLMFKKLIGVFEAVRKNRCKCNLEIASHRLWIK